MKILTEKEQKEKKIVELTQLKNKVIAEADLIKKTKDKEFEKQYRFFFPKEPNWKLVHSLDERMVTLYNVAEQLIEYRNLIEKSI